VDGAFAAWEDSKAVASQIGKGSDVQDYVIEVAWAGSMLWNEVGGWMKP